MALFEKGKRPSTFPFTDLTKCGRDRRRRHRYRHVYAGPGRRGTFSEAARLANYAGGIVVMKHGTRPVTYAELLRAVQESES
jgi:sugar/nucleoside kinase (ribokinase family)